MSLPLAKNCENAMNFYPREFSHTNSLSASIGKRYYQFMRVLFFFLRSFVEHNACHKFQRNDPKVLSQVVRSIIYISTCDNK